MSLVPEVNNGLPIGLGSLMPLSGKRKPYAALNLDFISSSALPDTVTFSRGTAATQYNSAGSLIWSPMNAIRNNTMVGAVAGTPGTPPTNWGTDGSTTALSRQIVGSGVDEGIAYVDYRIFGTAAAANYYIVSFEQATIVAALSGQTWTNSCYVKMVGGTTSGLTQLPCVGMNENSAAGAYVAGTAGASITPTSSWQRATYTRTFSGGATVAYAYPYFRITVANGASIDITLRIGMPQLQLGSTATAANATSGTAYYGPRFDYDPVTLAPNGLLIEEQRTNSIRNNTMQGAVAGTPGTYPTNWNGSTTGSGVTREILGTGIENGIPYMDIRVSGTTSAALFFGIRTETATQVAALNGQTWTSTFYVRLIGGSFTNILRLNDVIQFNDAVGTALTFGTNGIVPTGAALNTQKFTLTATASNASTAAVTSVLQIEANSGVAIDITLRIGLPQLELGAFATSVIPTYGAAATRNADVASMTGTNFSSWYNATQGTLYVEYSRFAEVNFQAVAYFGTPAQTDYMALLFGSSAPSNNQRFDVGVGGVSQASIAVLTTPPLNTITKTIGAYALNDFAATANGAAPGVDTVGTVPTVTLFGLGTGTALTGPYLNGWIRSIRYYPTRLSNATLQGLTV